MSTPVVSPHADAPAIGDTRLLIDGDRVDAAEGATFDVFNPATGELLAKVAEARAEDVDRAVKAARRAFESGPWRDMKPAERARVIWKLGDLLLENAAELGGLETLDNGKPFLQAKGGDVPAAAGLFHYMSGWATKLEGSTIPISFPGTFHTYTKREALGVVGLIVPWNFPLTIAAWKVAPALAAGNTIVLKPSEVTPLTALRLGELALEAGIPEGVLNVVPGFGADAGAALTAHPDVDKVSFTGSTTTGRTIMRAAEGNIKKLTLELGGKSPDIIFGDANLEAAIQGASDGIFYNQGEACAAGSRIYAHRSVYDEVVAGLSKAAEAIKVGDGFDPDSFIGPLVSKQHHEKVTGYVDLGREEGTVASGGTYAKDGGYFVTPTVFTNVTDESRVVREEIFGPVVSVLPFDDTDEVIRRANDTRYGLTAGVWTESMSTAHKMADALKAGTVWVNCYGVFDAAMPFGGYKESGWGREMGGIVLDDYTESKTVCIKVGD
ncbi:aldehyde dehydrogenase family protein [Patulibacter sp.]|uniref:aldehyde dehydrogenase family protein n=1 Tax=Patulibacter sp. TaxID=1912859 RepID=UPI00271F877D|nr:aldehyde dehydrogenase family protein [Patulibacter sp.]MDO9407751.1 aldehyde dehydrogenase family protein [Patulibacter sp.]